MEKIFTETLYVICHNGADIIHPMKVEAGANLTTGQPHYEEYSTEEEWKSRLNELGYKLPDLNPASASEEREARRELRQKIRSAKSPEERIELRQALRSQRSSSAKLPQKEGG